MSNSALGKMPRLDAVADPIRRKIFGAVENMALDDLKEVWAQIDGFMPGAKLLRVEAEAEGLYRDADTDKYLLLARIYLNDNVGARESLSAMITAVADESGEIRFESILPNIPQSGPALQA